MSDKHKWPYALGLTQSGDEYTVVWSSDDDDPGPAGTPACPKEAKQYVDADSYDSEVMLQQEKIHDLRGQLEAVTKLQKDNYGNATDTHIALAAWVESLSDTPARYTHTWDDSGERCLNCGDKDWMGGPCRPSPAPKASSDTSEG